MIRDALVVGVNTYNYEYLDNLSAPARDAEAVAQLLEKYGDFKVTRLPSVKDKQNDTIKVGQKTKVNLTQLEEAIVQLFKPDGKAPDMALLYFSGHGLRKNQGIQEGFLATSDVNPDIGNWGIRLKWLRELLQESEVKQQIIILDCCYSGELLNFTEADSGDRGQGKGRCFIAASRSFEVAHEEIDHEHSIFTSALLEELEPLEGRWVNNYNLVEKLKQQHNSFPQRPIFANSGEPINLTFRSTASVQISGTPKSGICPYKGLRSFDCIEEDAQYFYGRTALTDKLLEKVRLGNFLAVLGASGSGKSSVVRAGLLYQLKLGQRLSGSENWSIKIFKPGEHPLYSLATAFVDLELSGIERVSEAAKGEELIINKGTDGLRLLVNSLISDNTQRLVLVIDQFEESFTLCTNNEERKQFFEYLLGAVNQCGDKLCLVLTMRSDFFGKCTEQEYSGLAQQIQQNLVTVTPMTREELEQVIIKPAEQVDLEIEPELVEEMLVDVVHTPGSLPLLQDTLTQLWKTSIDNRLQLKTYSQLGGVIGTLRQRAQAVYESFKGEEQAACKHVFLALTQLGEGTENTRRRCFKQDLVNTLYSEELIDRVTQRLTDENLIVTDEKSIASNEMENTLERVAVIDVAHEALIRHWSTLNVWLEENRRKLHSQRGIEQAAQIWKENNKQTDFLLKGVRLGEAKDIYIKYADELSQEVQEFIVACLDERLREEKEQKKRLRKTQRALAVISVLGITATGFGSLAYLNQQNAQSREIEALNALSEASISSNQHLDGLITSLKAGKRLKVQSKSLLGASPGIKFTTLMTLQQAVSQTSEINRLQKHSQKVNAVSFSPDGKLIASVGNDKNLIIWKRNGKSIKTIPSEDRLTAINFSPDGKLIVVGSADHTLKLYSVEDELIKPRPFTPYQVSKQHQDWVTSVSFHPDSKTIVSASRDGTIKLWRIDGTLIKTLEKAHNSWVNTVKFSPDGQTIVSGGEDNLIKLWRSDGSLLKTLTEHQGRITQIKFSLDGKFIFSISDDKTVKIWDKQGKLLQTRSGYSGEFNSISINSKNNLLAIANSQGIEIVRFAPTFIGNSQVLQKIPNNRAKINDISFSPDGEFIASASNDKSVRIWQIKKTIPQNQEADNISSVAVNSQKSSEISFANAGWDGKIYLRRQDGSLLKTLSGHEYPVTAINFSSNGKFLASASNDKTIKLWDLENNTLVDTFTEHKKSVNSVSFSSKDKLLVSGSTDKTVKLWNQTGKLLKTFSKPTDTVSSVTFSPNGNMIAAGSYDRHIYLWYLNGTLVNKFTGYKSEIASVKFSPDGNTLASASWDNTIRLWDIRDAKQLQVLTGHTNRVTSTIFIANSKLLISGSTDGTIRLWNLKSGDLLKTLSGNIGKINSLSLTEDSQALVIGSENAGVKVWSLDLDKLMEQGCSIVEDYLSNNAGVNSGSAKVCN